MTQTLQAEQSSESLPLPWSAGETAASRPPSWWKNSGSNSHRIRNVGDRTKGAARCEEWQLIQRARAGDGEALSTLFTRNRTRLYRTAYSLLRNKEDAEDALQDGLLRAYLHLESFEGRARFSTWLTRIVINSALMNRRRINAHSPLPLEEFVAGDDVHWSAMAIDGQPDPEQLVAQSQSWNVVEKGIDQLSPVLRSALVLRDLQDLSTREAATAASVKISVIKSRLLRARRRLVTLVTARKKDFASRSCLAKSSAGRARPGWLNAISERSNAND
jgi:RNA polymerase sigma-70 factor (ECF subfamily)